MTQPMITDRPVTDWAPPSWGSPATPPPAKRKKIGRYILGGFALLIIIGIVGGGDEKDSSSSDGVAISTPTTSAGITRATSSPSSPSPSSSMSVATWASSYGASDADTLGEDMDAMMIDASAMDLAGLGSSCRTFQRHLSTAKSHLPTPDTELTGHLTDAYDYYNQAASACISAAAGSGVSGISASSTYLSLGTASLSKATTRLGELG